MNNTDKKTIFVSDLKETTEEFSSVFKVGVIEPLKTRAGKKFYNILLKDKTGVIKAKLWNDKIELAKGIKINDIVNIEGKTNRYAGTLQIIIKNMSRSDYSNEDDFKILSDKKILQFSAELDSLILDVKNSTLKKILKKFFDNKEIRSRFMSHPAAKSIHHCYMGGLLEHSVSMAKIAKNLSAYYGLDSDLMIAGALLHDIGKLQELTENGEYTREGQLLGHLAIGVAEIEKASRGLGEETPVILHLKHIIASHHGELEWGSIKKPLTAEAELLFNIDYMDSRQSIYKLKNFDLSNARFDNELKTTDKPTPLKSNKAESGSPTLCGDH